MQTAVRFMVVTAIIDSYKSPESRTEKIRIIQGHVPLTSKVIRVNLVRDERQLRDNSAGYREGRERKDG